MDGWNKNQLRDTGLLEVMDELMRLDYELKNCVKGAYSDCKTFAELSDMMRNYSRRLDRIADYLEELEEDDENY